VTARFFPLAQRMQRLFIEWAACSSGRLSYDFLDYLSLDFLREWRLRNLQSGKSTEELIADQHDNMERFEELAQALFLPFWFWGVLCGAFSIAVAGYGLKVFWGK